MLGAKNQPIMSARADFLFICICYSAVKRTALFGNGNCQKNTFFLCYISGYKFCSCTPELLQAKALNRVFYLAVRNIFPSNYSCKHCLIRWVPFAESPLPHLGLNPFPVHFFTTAPLGNLSKMLLATYTLS